MSRLPLAFAFLASLALPAAAAQRPVVVELFTSQGCSSCPPAEAVLRELAQTHADVLALGFHVDYWDRLGWKDPYSSAAATERQRAYQEKIGSEQIYTPQMVVDGRTDVLGSDREAAITAIGAAGKQAGNAVEVGLSRVGDTLTASIGAGRGSAKVLLVGFDPTHDTAVRRGENAGRTIAQANIVRSIATIGEWRGAELKITRPLPTGERLALLLQSADGRIVGVARERQP